jgi:hypothetical protein
MLLVQLDAIERFSTASTKSRLAATTSNLTLLIKDHRQFILFNQTKTSMSAKHGKTRGESASSVIVGAVFLHASSTPAPSIFEPNSSTGNHIKHNLYLNFHLLLHALPRWPTELPRPLREAVRWMKKFPAAGEDSETGGNIGIYTKGLYFLNPFEAFDNISLVHISANAFSP